MIRSGGAEGEDGVPRTRPGYAEAACLGTQFSCFAGLNQPPLCGYNILSVQRPVFEGQGDIRGLNQQLGLRDAGGNRAFPGVFLSAVWVGTKSAGPANGPSDGGGKFDERRLDYRRERRACFFLQENDEDHAMSFALRVGFNEGSSRQGTALCFFARRRISAQRWRRWHIQKMKGSIRV
jgi:hypothetical protein